MFKIIHWRAFTQYILLPTGLQENCGNPQIKVPGVSVSDAMSPSRFIYTTFYEVLTWYELHPLALWVTYPTTGACAFIMPSYLCAIP